MNLRFLNTTRDLFAVAARGLLSARFWAAMQFVGLALLIAAGLVWTRIPEKNVFEVILTLVVPLLVAAGFLALQAGFLRSLLRSNAAMGETPQPETSFALGALTLLLWIAIGWVLWSFIDSFDARTEAWASYLNSRFNADFRARVFTYQHISTWLDYGGWLLRWVIVPGLLLPLGCTALFALRRTPWRRIVHLWINWRWWPMVIILALVGETLPQTFFSADPKGSVQAQIWRVILKFIAAYLISILCWIIALAWAATLLIGPINGIDPLNAAALRDASPNEPEVDRAQPPLSLDNSGDHLRGNA
jgi:hypothetical protein